MAGVNNLTAIQTTLYRAYTPVYFRVTFVHNFSTFLFIFAHTIGTTCCIIHIIINDIIYILSTAAVLFVGGFLL